MLRRLAFPAIAAVLAAVTLPIGAYADQVRDQQWHLGYLHVSEAHEISQGDGVLVAVADSGVDPSAKELGAAVVPGNEFFGRSGDGRADTDGHGTAMAGIIAGRGTGGNSGNNGVLGIAPKANILPIRVSPSPGFGGSGKELAAGIEWAVGQHAKIICISLGTDEDSRVKAAIEKAMAADIVVVAAVGNRPGTRVVAFPAKLPGVVAVGAVDQQGRVSSASVTGPEVLLSAPGVDIMSTDIEGNHRQTSGTSDAAAIVAGAAALVRAKYPQLSAQDVIRRLTYTAQDAGAPGRDPEYGYGILDLVKALTAEVPPASPGAAPQVSASAGAGKDAGGGRSVAVIAAIGAAVVVVVFISVLQSIIRGRRRRG
ncbi:type VII secretion-associated serine protease mycosin [Dactylosporangium sp. NPDC048998]|uniref:type VII secretion-associated serine protease mycosin n=1 Tax=Dactylosporangium sp. NPDC048998 TaxID=3363976 RepID=UPI003720CAF3